MGKRKKRRKRRRAQERAEQARQEHLEELAAEDAAYEEDEQNDSSGSRFGFPGFGRSESAKDEPQYDDKPWWAEEEEDYELTDYERRQYGAYKEMPPPMQPEHLREPEEANKQADEGPSPIEQVAAVTTQEVGKVVERVKKIDWELVQVRLLEISDNVKERGKGVVEEVQFRNLQMREKVPEKFHIPIYIAIALVVIGIPLSIIVLMFAGGGNNPDIEVAVQATRPSENTVSVAPTNTPAPEVVVPTDEPADEPTDAPTQRPTNPPQPTNTPVPPTAIPATDIPPTQVPTNPPQPTDVPIAQPTTAPVVAASGGIAPFFAPPVQAWSTDIQQWSSTYGIEANYLAMIMQLETCGNPQFFGQDGRVGLFAVPLDRFQDGDAFIDPNTNALRAVELVMQCQALTGGDPGLTYACYRSNTDSTQVEFGAWSATMQQHFLWSLGISNDTLINAAESAALNDWLVNAGGFDVCNQAQTILDSQ